MRNLGKAFGPKWLAACAAVAALGASPAAAADLFGSAAIFTNRNCPAGATSCTAPGSLLQPRQYFGGAFTTFAASATLLNGASTAAAASFEGGGYLPTVKVGSTAGAFTRTGSSATALRAFTYGGDVAIDLAINGMLHFITSGDTPDPLGQESAGDGGLNVQLSMITVDRLLAAFPDAPDAVDLISSPVVFSDCGEAGVLAAGSYSTNAAGIAAGEYNRSIGLAACGGGPLTINPGDSFVVIASLQAISNRSGFLDAMHTLTVQYDEEHTYLAGTTDAVGDGFLARTVQLGASVPEPATWALMIGGFGLAGARLRRQRATA